VVASEIGKKLRSCFETDPGSRSATKTHEHIPFAANAVMIGKRGHAHTAPTITMAISNSHNRFLNILFIIQDPGLVLMVLHHSQNSSHISYTFSKTRKWIIFIFLEFEAGLSSIIIFNKNFKKSWYIDYSPSHFTSFTLC
jgi:hypothetical protein